MLATVTVVVPLVVPTTEAVGLAYTSSVLFAVADAFAEMVKVVPLRIAVTTEFAGMPVPATNWPTDRSAVEPTVIVALKVVVLALRVLSVAGVATPLAVLLLIGATPKVFAVPKFTLEKLL